jgi:pimeloyl-ACP methyl ester carboxylesterase
VIEISVGNLRFNAEARGEPNAPLVLMLHGFPQTGYAWRKQLDPLARAGYFAVAPDQRGYSAGARPLEQAEYATERLLADVLGMARSLGHERFHVVGHDWGGQLAWLLAGAHPQRILSLCALSRPHPAAFAAAFETDHAQAERSKHHRAFRNPETADLLLADDARRLRRSMRDQNVADSAIDAYLRVLGERSALEAALNWYRAAEILAIAHANPINVPTMYIWGDGDSSVGRAAAEGSADYVAGPYRFEELPNVGHFVTDQAGDRVTGLLLSFLGELDDS